jgi:hypothetical protein
VVHSFWGLSQYPLAIFAVKLTIIPFHLNPVVQEQEECFTAVLCHGISIQHPVRIIGLKSSQVVVGVRDSWHSLLGGCELPYAKVVRLPGKTVEMKKNQIGAII